jgi:hypothetical protein
MGLEAECTARVGRKTSAGTALLEGERLVFRGDFRLEVPFDSMQEVRVQGVALMFRTEDQEVTLELGPPVADRWARLIKEPKSLFEKLEVGPQSRVAVVDIADSLFVTALRERTASVAEGRVPEGAPIIFLGADNRESLRKIQLLRARMIDSGVLWVVRPKGSKEISEADVLEAIRAAGLVDTKVVGFSRTHTAHKSVIPVEQRGQATRPRPAFVSIPPSAPMIAALKKAAAKAAKAAARSAKSARKDQPKAKPRAAAKKKSAPKPKAKSKPKKRR